MGSADKPKCKIGLFKIYILVREFLNLIIWSATMITMIPEIERDEF